MYPPPCEVVTAMNQLGLHWGDQTIAQTRLNVRLHTIPTPTMHARQQVSVQVPVALANPFSTHQDPLKRSGHSLLFLTEAQRFLNSG